MSVGKVLDVSGKAYIRRDGSTEFELLTEKTVINERDTIFVVDGEVAVSREGLDTPLVLTALHNWQATKPDLDKLEPLNNALNVQVEADADGDQLVGFVSSQTFVISVALPSSLSANADKITVQLDSGGTEVEVSITNQMRADGVVSIPYHFSDGAQYGVNYQFNVELVDNAGKTLLESQAKVILLEGQEPSLPGVDVRITQDVNNDGKLDEAELLGVKRVKSELTLDQQAEAGDILWVRVNSGQWRKLTTLKDSDIDTGSVMLTSAIPKEGETLKVEARIEAVAGGLGLISEDQAKVELTTPPDAPTIVISEDRNSDQVLNAAELGNQKTISTIITLGNNNAVGDRLVVWQSGPKTINGWKGVKVLTQEDIDKGTVNFEVQRPPENWNLSVKARTIGANGLKSEHSPVDTVHIDTIGPKLKITTDTTKITHENVEVTFSFDEAPKNFVEGDVEVSGGVLSGFTYINGKEWTANFQADGTEENPQILVYGRNFTDHYDNLGQGNKLVLELENRKPEAPEVEISRDSNNDGVINSIEMQGHNDIEVTFRLRGQTQAGDYLHGVVNGKNIYHQLTQKDIDKGFYVESFRNPGEGKELKVQASVRAPGNESSELSNVDTAFIDTLGPNLTIKTYGVNAKGSTKRIHFCFDDAPEDFDYEDIIMTGGTLADFEKFSDKEWKATFVMDDDNTVPSVEVKGHSFTDINDNTGTGDSAELYSNSEGVTFTSEGEGAILSGFTWHIHSQSWLTAGRSGSLSLPEFKLNDTRYDEVYSIKLTMHKSDADYNNQEFVFLDGSKKTTRKGNVKNSAIKFNDDGLANVNSYYTEENGAFKTAINFTNGGFNRTVSKLPGEAGEIENHNYGIDFTLTVQTRDTQTGKKTTSEIDFELDVTEAIAWTTPLVLDLDGDGVETTSLAGSNIFFDLDADGHSERAGWVAADDGLLVRDLNGDGLINDGSELFGEGTDSELGGKSEDGFAALAELDSNADGVIDASDEAYAELQIWQDSNGDGISQAHELFSLVEMDVVSIDLSAESIAELDNGNFKGLRSSWSDSTGEQHLIDDVWFAVQNSQAETLDISDLLASNEQLVSDVATATTAEASPPVVCSCDTSLAALTRELLEQPTTTASDLG